MSRDAMLTADLIDTTTRIATPKGKPWKAYPRPWPRGGKIEATALPLSEAKKRLARHGSKAEPTR